VNLIIAFRFYKMRGVDSPAEDLLASQETLCSMEFSYWLGGERSALLPKEGAVLPVNRRLGGAPSQCECFGEELTCGNKMPTRCNRGFYCRSYCLLNMFRAPLCPSSGAQEYYTVVAACGFWCCGFQVVGLVWS